MKVTNCQVFIIEATPGNILKANARVVLGESLQLTSLRVYQGTKGLFVSYPNDPNSKGEGYRQLFYPVTRELRMHIEEVILKEYEETLKGKCVLAPKDQRILLDVEDYPKYLTGNDDLDYLCKLALEHGE